MRKPDRLDAGDCPILERVDGVAEFGGGRALAGVARRPFRPFTKGERRRCRPHQCEDERLQKPAVFVVVLFVLGAIIPLNACVIHVNDLAIWHVGLDRCRPWLAGSCYGPPLDGVLSGLEAAMNSIQFALMLFIIGGIAIWTMWEMILESFWYAVPAIAVLVFAGVLHFFSQRPDPATKRRAQVFGIGFSALLASAVFAMFVYGCIGGLQKGGISFDYVSSCVGISVGGLAAWLWFRFVLALKR